MTRPPDPFERVREANPVPSTVEPDWESIRNRVGEASAATPSGRSRIRGVLAGLAACAAASTVAVLALAPSGGSPDFLARAAAALAPTSGTILYERWEATIGPEPGNVERRQAVTLGPDQLWIEADRPRRYRTILMPRREPERVEGAGVDLAYTYGADLSFAGRGMGALARVQRANAGLPLELGGAVEGPTDTQHPHLVQPTLTLLPGDLLLRARLDFALGASLPGPHDMALENGADPVSALRQAIAEGRARLAGTTQLDGRSVQRIDIHLPDQLPPDAPPLPADHPVIRAEAYAYVEPETFHPVEIHFAGETYRFLAYEYLPDTPANRALTDIRAQHPRASIVNAIPVPPGRRSHTRAG